ncbi:MAG: hypothetical protein JWM34_2723 [Ilumatobacteraceae bacterium]|nr:hypothetical protein [Ilumatobacteraceae bacterium]
MDNETDGTPEHQSPARLASKAFGTTLTGVLVLRDGRLTFTSGPDVRLDAPIGSIERLEFPWIMFGGFRFFVDDVKYVCVFSNARGRPTVVGAGRDIATTGKLGKGWKQAFQQVGLLTA